jgi:uncharacterized protein (TIGR02466 family)
MELFKLFSIPVIRYPAEVETYDSIQVQLRESIHLMKESNDITCMSSKPQDGISKTYNFLEKYNCDLLNKRILESCMTYLKEIGWSGICEGENPIVIKNSWVNFTNTGESRNPHVHPGYKISGVYYFRVSEVQGGIYFNNPNPLGMACEFPSGYIFPQTHDIVPDDGDIILFPSWLVHGTRECKSETERISIAFNIDLNVSDDLVFCLSKGSHMPTHPKEVSMKGLLRNAPIKNV